MREVKMWNDQGDGSGALRKIHPGESIKIPAVIDPLPAGSYSIQVRQGKSARVIIKNDGDLLHKCEQDLLARIREGDLLAQQIAGKYPSNSLIGALLQDLLSDDDVVGDRAADPLIRIGYLPPNAAQVISKAMAKHIGFVKQRGSAKTLILPSLASLAATIGTDEALEAVLTLARTEMVRGAAVMPLGKFKQEKAAQQLQRFLKDENDDIQFHAAQALADRKDAAALEVLLVVAHDPKSRRRAYSFEVLLKYPDDPRIEPAIKSGLDDTDSFVRGSAEFALRTLRPAKKP
jgi:HEAT repeat protein